MGKWVVGWLGLFMIAGLGNVPAHQAMAQTTHVRVAPETNPVDGIGQTFSVDIVIEDYANFRGYSIELLYDPSVVMHTGISKGNIFNPFADILLSSGSDAAAGRIVADHVILGSDVVTGAQATAFSVTFEAVGNGTTDLAFGLTRLRDNGNNEITHTTQGGEASVGEDPVFIADLALSMQISNANPVLGDHIEITLELANDGPDEATGVIVTDELPDGLLFINATASVGTYDNTTGAWNVGTLSSGGTATLLIEAETTAEVTLTNRAQVLASDQTDPDSIPGNSLPAEDDDAEVVVTVGALNLPPQVQDDIIQARPGQSVMISVLANDIDPEGQLNPASVFITSAPVNGIAVANANGSITYVANVGFLGTDQLTYRVQDTQGATSADATVTITVSANQAPQFVSTPPTTVAPGTSYLYQIEAADAEGDPVFFSAPLLPEWLTLLDFTNGTGSLSGTPDEQGSTASVILRVQDQDGAFTEQAFDITITANAPPSTTADQAETDEEVAVEITVLANDTDAEGDPLTLTAVSTPANGTTTFTVEGVVTYQPGLDFFGVDQFTYTVTDGFTPQTETVMVTVLPVNDAPGTTSITAPLDGALISVEGDPSQTLVVSWNEAVDPDNDPLSYVWQLSQTETFGDAEVIYVTDGAEATQVEVSFEMLAALLDQLDKTDQDEITTYHRVVASDGQVTTASDSQVLYFIRGTLTDIEVNNDLPQHAALLRNYPNPFTDATTISFTLPKPMSVRLVVTDALGRHLATLQDRLLAAGTHAVSWQAQDAPSGLYFYRLITEEGQQTRSMLHLK